MARKTQSPIDASALLSRLSEQVERDPVARQAAEDEDNRLTLLASMRARRQDLGLSQKRLASRMDTTQSAVSDIESGRGAPQFATFQRYARAVGGRLDVALVDATLPAFYGAGTAKSLWQLVERRSLGALFTALVTNRGKELRTLRELAVEAVRLPEPVVEPMLRSLERRGWIDSEVLPAGDRSYRVSNGASYMVGVSIRPDGAHGVMANLYGEVLQYCFRDFESHAPSHVLRAVLDAVHFLRTEEGSKDLLGVGVTLAGIVQADGRQGQTGVILFASGLMDQGAWPNYPLEAELQDALSESNDILRVAVENDANALALHEYVAHGVDSVLTILLTTTGLGSGFALKGHAAYGATSTAGEIGHLVVDPEGPPCHSGFKHRGCLEAMASPKGILRSLGMEQDTPDAITRSLKAANERIAAGDVEVEAAFRKAGFIVGEVLANSVACLNPNRVAFYGPSEMVGHPHAFDSQIDPVARLFRSGVSDALGSAYPPGEERFGYFEPEWVAMDEHTLPVAAAHSAMRHFLVDPWHWHPEIVPEVDSEDIDLQAVVLDN